MKRKKPHKLACRICGRPVDFRTRAGLTIDGRRIHIHCILPTSTHAPPVGTRLTRSDVAEVFGQDLALAFFGALPPRESP